MSKGIIAQIGDKNNFGGRINTENNKFKVGDIATDGSFSCRPIMRIEITDNGLLYYFEGILFPCPERTLLTPEESTQPLFPPSPPFSVAKYKVGDYATAMIGDAYQFTCRRILRIERYCGPFHYFLEGLDIGYPEEHIVLASLTVPQVPLWDGQEDSEERELPAIYEQKPESNTAQTSDEEANTGSAASDSEQQELTALDTKKAKREAKLAAKKAKREAKREAKRFAKRQAKRQAKRPSKRPAQPNVPSNDNELQERSVELYPDLVYWANLGARFTLLKNEYDAPCLKNPQPMGKNWPHCPHSVAQAQEHLNTGGGIGLLCGAYSNRLICLEIDELGVEKARGAWPQLANMPYIAHDSKPGRAKFFFYAPEGIPNNSYGFKVDGKRIIYVEILSDNKQTVLLDPSDKRYILFNQELEVPTLTKEQISQMWRALVAVCPDNQSAEAKKAIRFTKRVKRQAEREARRALRAGPPSEMTQRPTCPVVSPFKPAPFKPATKKQIRFGAKFSLDLSGSTCVEASLAIEKAMAEFGPPATDNQKTYLERYGVDTTNISFDEAKATIEEIGVWREGLAAEIHSELDGRRSANGWYRCECVFCPPSKSSNGTPKRNMGYTIETGSDFDEIGFVCHKCGEKGGTLDLANELGFSYRGVISFSKKKKVPVVPKPEVKEEPLWKQSPRQYQIDLANLRDLNSRWQGYKPLLPETIKRFGLGYGTPPDGFYGPGLIIPVTENGEIVGFRCRHTTGELKNQWRTVTGSKTTLFNSDLVTEGCIVVVTENNVDSLLMMQEIPEIDGIPVVGVSSSSGVWSWRKEWSKTLARARLVVMATDNDHAGQPSEEYQVLLESEHQLKTDARAAEDGKPLPPMRLSGGFKAYRSLLKAGANVVVFPWAVDKMDVGDYLTGVIANKALSEGGAINEQWSVYAGRAGKEEAAYEERFGFLNEESVFHDFLARHSELNVRECQYVRPRLWEKEADAQSPSVTGTIHNRATVERISIAELRRRRRNDAQRTAAPEPELDTADKAHHGPRVTGTIYNRATIERIPITELRRRRKNDAQRTAAPEPIEQPLRTPEPPTWINEPPLFPPEGPPWISEEPIFPPEEQPFLPEPPPWISEEPPPEQLPWINEDSASLEAEYWANDPYPDAPPWMNETPLVNETSSSSFLRVNKLIMLPSDKKVSDIFDMNSLPLGISLVQAPPSGGKSTAAIRQFDKWRILLVPTQDLAKQKGNETDEPIVLEGFSPRFDDDRRLISTYDGLLKIVRKAAKLVEDLSKYNLVIDEFHRFVTDDYRDILRDVLALAPRFNRIVLMTATPPPALPLAGPIYYVKIVPEIKPELHVFSAHVTDYSSVILNELKDVELVEYHENDKAKCLAIKEILEKRGVTGIYLFNADTKKLDYHKKMINEGTLPDDARLLLVTSLYNDGFNFFTHKRRSLIITAKSRLSAIDMEQFSARIRNNPAVRAILARLGKTEAEPFDYQRTIASKRARAKIKAAAFNVWHENLKNIEREFNGEQDDERLNEIARRTIERDGATKGLIYADGKWGITMLTCDQRSHSAWATACNRDHQFMVRELNKFGNYDWRYCGEYQFFEAPRTAKAIKKETTEIAKEHRQEHREAVREAASQITSIVEAEKIDTNWQNQTAGDESYKAASRILKLVDAGMLFESAHQFMTLAPQTPNAVTRLATKIELASFRIGTDAGRLASQPQSRFLRAFMNLLTVGEKVSWDGRGGTRNVREAINGLRGISIEADHAYQLEHLESEEQQRKKVMGLLSDCFGVKDAKVNDEGKRKDVWEIVSLVAVCFEKLRPLQIQKEPEPEPEFDADDSDMEEVREVHQASLHLDTESVQPDTFESFSSLERGDTDDYVYSPTPVNPYGW